MSFSDQYLSIVSRPRRRWRSCRRYKQFTVLSSSLEPIQFQPNLAQSILWVKGVDVCLNEKLDPLSRGDNTELLKIRRILTYLKKIFFLKNESARQAVTDVKHNRLSVIFSHLLLVWITFSHLGLCIYIILYWIIYI